MLFHYLEARTPGVDVEQLEIEINEPVDAGVLARAWAIVAAQPTASQQEWQRQRCGIAQSAQGRQHRAVRRRPAWRRQ